MRPLDQQPAGCPRGPWLVPRTAREIRMATVGRPCGHELDTEWLDGDHIPLSVCQRTFMLGP